MGANTIRAEVRLRIQRPQSWARHGWFAGPTLARITVGVVFVGTGWGKLHALADVTAFFRELGIPFPGINARVTAMTELVGGALVLLGAGTRLAAIPLAFTMLVAITTAKRAEITGLSALFGFIEWTYLVLFVWLAVAGAGPLSIDGVIARWRTRRRLGGTSAAFSPQISAP